MGVDRLAVYRRLRVAVLASGDEHELTVVDTEGENRTVVYRPPPPDINENYLARTAVGLIGLVCALVAVLTTRRREATTFMLLACASFVIGAVPHRTAASEASASYNA